MDMNNGHVDIESMLEVRVRSVVRGRPSGTGPGGGDTWPRDLDEGHVCPVDVVAAALRAAGGHARAIEEDRLDALLADTAATMVTTHPDYGRLAARFGLSIIYRSVTRDFSQCMLSTTNVCKLSRAFVALVRRHADRLDAAVQHGRDTALDYFGLRTLERSYLLRGPRGELSERPQHAIMRVALGIHGDHGIEDVVRAYDRMSSGLYTHASPTIFHAGLVRPQLSSCFLMTMKDDSIEGIFDTIKQCALVSKHAGGIGISISNIRAEGSRIGGTGGTSNGILPMLRVVNATARYVDQGGGKRKGAIAVYMEPWHADVRAFLQLRRNTGAEEQRARDVFMGLWVPDLFMERVENDGKWSLFCPNEAPGLQDACGDEFRRLYESYEGAVVAGTGNSLARHTMGARELWSTILESQGETGQPYMLFKDACNAKSNQRHLGTIRGSNLCTEVVQYASADEVACCNLASVSLPAFVRGYGQGGEGDPPPVFDFKGLMECTEFVVVSLDRAIDNSTCPLPEAARSNQRHRPMSIGVQGFSDMLSMMGLPFESSGAADLNREVFEAMYFAACTASCRLAEECGAHSSHSGSPASEGKLQFDLWGVKPSSRHDWASLRGRIHTHGMRNSLLVGLMPTASTATILRNSEGIEPWTAMIQTRRTLAGDFVVVNRYLVADLCRRGLWCEAVKDGILRAGGSLRDVAGIPDDLRSVYKTAWEIPGRTIVDLAAGRGPFVDQSQSSSAFIDCPRPDKLTSLHFYAWKAGLKTGMYYLRSRAAASAVRVTLVPPSRDDGGACAANGEPGCESCAG